jgi:small-conductance mechanosensitive channel
MQSTGAWLEQTLSTYSPNAWKIAASFLIVLLLWLIYQVALRVVNKRLDDALQLYRWRKSISLLVIGAGAFILGWMWLPVLQSWATFLGLVSAGIVIALQGPITDLAGWLFIIFRRPFEAGDRIELGEHRGDVIDIRLFQFTLLEIGNWVEADQSTGRILHIPNGHVFTQALANYSRGFMYIWNEIPVLVTFESNWEKAKAILLNIGKKHAEHLSAAAQKEVRRAARRFMIYYPTLTPTVYTSVEDSGVRLGSEQAIWEHILRAFDEHPDLEFAYPSQRIFARWFEHENPPTKEETGSLPYERKQESAEK